MSTRLIDCPTCGRRMFAPHIDSARVMVPAHRTRAGADCTAAGREVTAGADEEDLFEMLRRLPPQRYEGR